MQRDEDQPRDETVEELVHEAKENWGSTTEHELQQARGQAQPHLTADDPASRPPGDEDEPPQPPPGRA